MCRSLLTLAQGAPRNPGTPGTPGSYDTAQIILLVVLVVVGLVVLSFLLLIGRFLNLWLQAWISDAPVSFVDLIGMAFRKVDVRLVVFAHIRAAKAGLGLSLRQLEGYYLEGGHVAEVVNALIAAKYARIPLTWDDACAMDRGGEDVLAAVRGQADTKPAPPTARP